MNTVAFIVGYLVLAAFAIALIAVAVVVLHQTYEKFLDRERNIGAELARQNISARLHQDAWWFSEDAATMKLLQSYAHDYQRGVTADVDGIRERWRKAREVEHG